MTLPTQLIEPWAAGPDDLDHACWTCDHSVIDHHHDSDGRPGYCEVSGCACDLFTEEEMDDA